MQGDGPSMIGSGCSLLLTLDRITKMLSPERPARPALRHCGKPDTTNSSSGINKKVVRFKNSLENVRLFSKFDQPQAVSKPPSLRSDHLDGHEYIVASAAMCTPSPFRNTESHISMLRFFNRSTDTDCPVTLEEMRIHTYSMSITGSVVVKNLAFQKQVVCRFTLDNWATMSEVNAEYCCSAETQHKGSVQDGFKFSIQLTEFSKLGDNTLSFCIRYLVDGNEFWDNNSLSNFQFNFKVKQQDLNAVHLAGQFRNRRYEIAQRGTINSIPYTRSDVVVLSNLENSKENTSNAKSPVVKAHTSLPMLSIGTLARRYDLSNALVAVTRFNDCQSNKTAFLPTGRFPRQFTARVS